MNVEMAEAQLALAKAEAAYLEAKSAYQDGGDKAPFKKAQARLVAARDTWRNDYRSAPSGPGDAAVSPDPVSVSLEVN